MPTYKTPGVYVEEISTLPPSVAGVSTAVPAFIGYTENGPSASSPVIKRISTMLDFVTEFGGASSAKFSVTQAGSSAPLVVSKPLSSSDPDTNPPFSLYYALNHYFKNGGGPCYVVSVGNYVAKPSKDLFSAGIAALEEEDEPTLIVLTDAASLLSANDYYAVCSEALAQCKKLGDRFTILDVVKSPDSGKQDHDFFRDSVSTNLNYGAAYTPHLQSSMSYTYLEEDVTYNKTDMKESDSSGIWSYEHCGLAVTYSGADGSPFVSFVGAGGSITFESDDDDNLLVKGVSGKTAADVVAAWNAGAKVSGYSLTAVSGSTSVTTSNGLKVMTKDAVSTMASLQATDTSTYNQLKTALGEQRVVLPPSAAVAGVYARVDRDQGVWKAPANIGLLATIAPAKKITDEHQERLNVDPTAGKSINAIRSFAGKGILVWGARTLAGNDNEWRYISVRRLFINIEESTKKASAFAVFEPNNQSTWLKVRVMIESFLYGLWQRGALVGATSEQAYYVNIGLGTTMTEDDVLNGRMVVEIGVAAVRPAEFIVLKFSHKLQTT